MTFASSGPIDTKSLLKPLAMSLLLVTATCECITLIINQSITTGIFPDRFKVAKVVPIFKKNDQSDIKNYRPISVLPTISKLFENVMQTQLMEYFTSHNLLASQQYGFRSNRSTELAALELMDRNVNCMNQNSCPINIYIDLSKALDSLKYHIYVAHYNDTITVCKTMHYDY